MIIGIDVNPATRSQKTGTEWYTTRLVEALKGVSLLSGDELKLYSREILQWPFKRLWTQGRLAWEMLRRPPDVLFVPAHAVPWIHPKKTVTTIHDVGFKRFPKLYESKARRYLEVTTKQAVKRCTKLIVPSEFTKQELMELYKVPADKIVVTPLAPGHGTTPGVVSEVVPEVLRKFRLTTSYFLTVSRMEAKKNLATLIRAFELFKERRGIGDPFQLVLVGKPGFGYQQVQMLISRSPAKEFIRELGWVDDQDVTTLMSGAFSYVYPSWYEGLGISAIEAMASGAALIASDIPALREAAGDAALYFNPDSPEELARVMGQLVEEATVREELIKKGQARAATFDWEKTAELTWSVLKSL